jgi:uncharacterized protein YfdQ (DUF2303 family)
MPEIDNVKTLLNAGAAAVEPETFSASDDAVGELMTAVVPSGYEVRPFDLERHLAPHRAAPRRVKASVTVTDTASWLAYFGKHGSEHSEVYGDVNASTVTAILNAPHGPAEPAWGDHRVTLQLTHSPAWDAWVRLNGQFLPQDQFAEHLEARTPDLREPDAATMLELAQSFQATKGVTFESGSQLASGQRRLQYLETIEGKAGNRGQLDVPSVIKLQVPVWRGIAFAVPLTARFRFRISREGLLLAYVIDQLEDQLDAAWTALLGQLTETLPVPVLAGRAPTYS